MASLRATQNPQPSQTALGLVLYVDSGPGTQPTGSGNLQQSFNTVITVTLALLLVCIILAGVSKVRPDPQNPYRIYQDYELIGGENKVRLLRLLPGRWDQRIECELQIVDLDNLGPSRTGHFKYPYIALSYSWGETLPGLRDLPKRRIYVSKKRFEVSASLELVLRHLRSEKGDVLLWVDAICINQNDKRDKSRQVMGMRDMYAKAKSVEIWLGPARDILEENKSINVNQILKDRFAPTIKSNPRQGLDFTWHDHGEDGFDAPKDPRPLRRTPSVLLEIGASRECLPLRRPKSCSDLSPSFESIVRDWGRDDRQYESFREAEICKEYLLLREMEESWRKYHNFPASRRAYMVEEPDYTQQCFCMIHQLAGDAFRTCNGRKNKLRLADRILFLMKDSARNVVFKVFAQLMNASWWARTWVIQEIVVADKVFVRYGRYRIHWDLLVCAARKLTTHRRSDCCSTCFDALPSKHIDQLAQFTNQISSLQKWRHLRKKEGLRQNEELRRTEMLRGKGTPQKPVDMRRGSVQTSESGVRLLTLLWHFRHRETTDPRDKVYALLPLVSDWGNSGPDGWLNHFPDYDNDTDAVFKGTFRKIVDMENDLTVLLGNTRKSPKLADKLPTWVPDWFEKPLPGEYERLQRAKLYNASGKRRMEKSYLSKDTITIILKAEGVRLDIIKGVSDIMPHEQNDKGLARAQTVHRRWATFAGLIDEKGKMSSDKGYPHASYKSDDEGTLGKPEKEQLSLQDAYGRLLCMDTTRSDGDDEYDDDNERYINRFQRANDDYDQKLRYFFGQPNTFKHFRRNMDAGFFDPSMDDTIPSRLSNPTTQHGRSLHDNFDNDPPRPPKDPTLEVNEVERSAVMGRRLFETEDGYLGLGPDDVQEGDIVVIIFGCPMPLIVRDAGKRYVSQDSHSNARHELRLHVPNMNGDGDVPVNCYTLIGDAYVQGAMYGEAVENEGIRGIFLHLV